MRMKDRWILKNAAVFAFKGCLPKIRFSESSVASGKS